MFHIIINPHAGSGKTMSEWEKAEPELKRLGVSYVTTCTEGPRTAIDIVYRAAIEGGRDFVAVGGDGTVHEVLSGIMKFVDSPENQKSSHAAVSSDFSLSVIPIGSGNDWIKSTGVPNDVKEAVRLIAEGSFAQQDVIRVSTESGIVGYMANIGGIAFDAEVCADVNRRKEAGRRSSLIYVEGLFNVLFHYNNCPLTVECDGKKVFSGDCFTIALANGKYSGGGFRQTSSETSMKDGLLDISVIPDITPLQFMFKVPGVFTGTLYKTRPVKAFRGRKITVTPNTERREYFEVDGEVIGRMPVTYEVLPQKISVLSGKTFDNQKNK